MAHGGAMAVGAIATDDDQFVQRLINGQNALYSWIALQLPFRQDTEEVYQQTCLVLWKKRDCFDPTAGTFLAWACGVARLEVRSYMRRHHRERAYLSREALDAIAEPVESGLAAGDSAEALESCLQKLPADQFALIEACYLDARSPAQIAAQESLTPAALYMRLHRIRRRLLDCLNRSLSAGEME